MAYKYASAHDWLIRWAGKLNEIELYHEFCTIVHMLDSDMIQNEYQKEMDKDGYFDDEGAEP